MARKRRPPPAASGNVAARGVSFRASRHIVGYWEDERFVLHQFASDRRVVVDPAVVQLLQACRSWRTFAQLAEGLDAPSRLWIRRALSKLSAASLLERSDRARSARELAYDRWQGWNPAAGFFHSATRDVAWAEPEQREAIESALQEKAARVPPPSPIRSHRGLSKVALPTPQRTGAFPEVLLARRTWRAFSARPLSLNHLSTLLWLTGGVSMWGTSLAGERVAFKTSPSAGSKHPIELYVLVRNVKGLPPGIYHYGADRHRLAVISKRLTAAKVESYLGHQWQFRDAAAVVLLVASVARTNWTYPYARAYRSLLAEAGHVCQTFCLAATWLELAPFCTMALADSAIEKALGIDGVTDAVLYAAGVGVKPDHGSWVQWPEHAPGKPYTPPRRR